jgi:thymidylate synthase (FAD)
MIDDKIPVLDHGYVQFIEAWGRGKDARARSSHQVAVTETVRETAYDPDYEIGIIEAARQSTQGSFQGWESDAKLLRYLYQNKHATPFEFSGMVIEVQAPIFVFREWHRHRTQSYNEMSARYAPLPDICYTPLATNVMTRGEQTERTRNRQAQGTRPFNPAYVSEWLEDVGEVYALAEATYQAALDNGIPKEIARITMPVGHYTRMRASANLRCWLAFLTLRMDPMAQWEIRQYADTLGQIIGQYFPQTWALFCGVK